MNSLCLWLLLAAIVQSAVSQDAPAITFVSSKQIKNIGDTVDLKCSTTNARDFPIRWVKVEAVDNIYISTGSALLIPDSRYSVTYDYTSSSITLRISNLRSTDAGIYQCRIYIAPDNILHSTDVEVVLQ